MRIYTPDAVRAAEQYMIEYNGCTDISLMKRAAEEIYYAIEKELSKAFCVCVLCGKGNNSGDGYELARIIRQKGIKVCCVRVFGEAPCTYAAEICHDYYLSDGGIVVDEPEACFKAIATSDVVIDAMFGIGFRGRIESDSMLYKMISAVNCSAAKKIALDVPSGINAYDGSIGGIAFAADITISVGVLKTGMLSYPAKKYCGVIRLAEIGLVDVLVSSFEQEHFVVADDEYVREALPLRAEESNKDDFGKLLCICGSENMPGAAVMAVGSALRGGAGLVTLASEKSVIDVVKIKYPEPIYSPVDFDDEDSVKSLLNNINNYSAVLIGCGFGNSENKKKLTEQIIKTYKGRLIIDADGINVISDNINILEEAEGEVIITPHPGEFSRISGKSVEEINETRIKSAKEFSGKYKCITVLKGAGTIISKHGEKTAVNTTGNPGLAKGGSGDVLAGLIAALAANKAVKTLDAAICGVYLHGKAADILKEKISEYGLLPSELSKEIAKLLP